jgi:soluble lytic murein transglycosylase-like protein
MDTLDLSFLSALRGAEKDAAHLRAPKRPRRPIVPQWARRPKNWAVVPLVVLAATPLVHERLTADAAPAVTVRMAPPATAPDHLIASAWRERLREVHIAAAVEEFRAYRLTPEMAGVIYDAAVAHDIDPEIAFGLVRAESSFRNAATSRVGAVGITQLMPRTARWMQPGVSNAALRDPAVNADIGFRYLRYLLDKYDGDERLALLAYNRGPGTVDRILRRGGNPDNGYVRMVRRSG